MDNVKTAYPIPGHQMTEKNADQILVLKSRSSYKMALVNFVAHFQEHKVTENNAQQTNVTSGKNC